MRGTDYEHVVLVSIDTLRSDALAVHPAPLWPTLYPDLSAPSTSVLDELAAQGTYFTNCVSAAPYTSSAHASILTGQWPARHGMYEFFNRRLQARTAFARARREGRRTLLKTDFPLVLGPHLGFDADIDTYVVEDDAAFLDALTTADGPTFSLAHFGGVHIPYGFHNLRYGGEDYRRRLLELEDAFPSTAPLPKDQLFETVRDDDDAAHLLRYKRVIETMWHDGRAQDIFGLYLEGVEYFLEHRFTPFLEKLMTTLRGTRWLLVLFGDHGEEYSDESFGHFNAVAEGALRVPLIFVGSDVEPRVATNRVRTVDILPTILELTGSRSRATLDGSSLASVLRGGPELEPRTAYAQTWVADTTSFVRFQRRMMTEGRKQGTLPHVLFREAVWDGEHKLSRHLADFNVYLGEMESLQPAVTKLERFDPDGRPHVVQDAETQQRLAGLLASYNDLRTRGRR